MQMEAVMQCEKNIANLWVKFVFKRDHVVTERSQVRFLQQTVCISVEVTLTKTENPTFVSDDKGIN